MATPRYFHTNYWEPDYFSATWWAADPGTDRLGQIAATVELDTPGTDFWAEKYWSSTYWSSNYWGGSTSSVFIGTFSVAGTRSGTIDTTVDVVSAFTGPVVQVENLDLTITVAIPWIPYEIAGVTGTIADTLAAATSSVTGTFVASGGITGSIAVTLAESPANFDGTHVAPANVTGTIGDTLGPLLPAITGQVFAAGTALGTIGVTLEGMSSDITGTMAPGNKTGTIAETLDDYTGLITGVFADSGVVIGSIEVTLDDVQSNMAGTAIGDPIITAQSEHRKAAHNVVSVGERKGRRSSGTRRGRKRA